MTQSKHKVRRATTTPVVGDPLVVIPTTLLRLTRDQAWELNDILADQRRANPFVDPPLLAASAAASFWIDLVQLVREAPDLAEGFRDRGCRMSAGCRVNTNRKPWLHHLLRELEDGAYQRGGTSWVQLQYAVIAIKATRISVASAQHGTLAPHCVRQRELPCTSLHAVPPMTYWEWRVQPLRPMQ